MRSVEYEECQEYEESVEYEDSCVNVIVCLQSSTLCKFT